jgi:hypothetical protein
MIMAEESIWPENNKKRVKPEMTTKMGAPKSIKSRRIMIKRMVIRFLLS